MRRLSALAVVILLASCSDGAFDALPDPGEVTTAPAVTTSVEPDLTGVPLNPVPGDTTTSVALGPGPMTIVGIVEGPDGVIPGAVVQLERLVGDGVATTRVPTAPDGTWNLEKVLGGRYRIRAWRAPDLATSRAQIVFIESGPQRSVTVKVDAVGGVHVDVAIAPDPPVVDRAANLKVRVIERSVDGEGVVRDAPKSGEPVELSGSGEWELESPSPSTTDDAGAVTFRVQCGEAGSQPLFATLADGQAYALALPDCFDPSATTTSTTAADGSSTSSSSTTTVATSTTTTTTG